MTGELSSEREECMVFLNALFGCAPEEMFCVLWTLADKHTHWFSVGKGPDALADSALRLAGQSDVYVGVSVASEPAGPHRRISSENSAGIMGLWVDVDIADPDVHKKWNLPPDEKSAEQLLEACGLEPSLVVHSGHGLQAWWLFEEFWAFENEQQRLGVLGHQVGDSRVIGGRPPSALWRRRLL